MIGPAASLQKRTAGFFNCYSRPVFSNTREYRDFLFWCEIELRSALHWAGFKVSAEDVQEKDALSEELSRVP